MPIDKPTDRRTFLSRCGLGGVALAWMLHRDGIGEAAGAERAIGQPHFPPRAKNVIWLFMVGGTSHVESFDPKPALNRYAGLSIDETPHKDVLTSPYLANERDLFEDFKRERRTTLFPMQTTFQRRGDSGLEISDWWPHLSACADDLAVVRSVWTEDIDHGAQLQFHTGRHRNDGFFPTIGSWINYGLGSLNANLPEFVVMGQPLSDCCGGREAHRANYLGPQYDGVPLAVGSAKATPYISPPQDVFVEEQRGQYELLRRLNRLTAERYPDDESIRARIESYELAYRMQTAVPEIIDLAAESPQTQQLYGLDQATTQPFGEQLLTARRLVERGVRFIQIYHGSNGGAGGWDAHKSLKNNHSRMCAQVDQPIAGLLADLKQRGLLDETLVVWATEFGRTPGSQNGDGRDHHPFGFSIWMAGGGIKRGVVHGATDELGFHAVEDRHYVTDIHATVMHQLGLDSRRLELPGRQRLDRDHGTPIHAIIG